MQKNIYHKYKNRPVKVPEAFEDDVLNSIRNVPRMCRENVLMVLEELESYDPDLDERCGLVADRYEVFSVCVPRCGATELVISVDLKLIRKPAMVHGMVAKRGPKDQVRKLCIKHRNLINPSWE